MRPTSTLRRGWLRSPASDDEPSCWRPRSPCARRASGTCWSIWRRIRDDGGGRRRRAGRSGVAAVAGAARRGSGKSSRAARGWSERHDAAASGRCGCSRTLAVPRSLLARGAPASRPTLQAIGGPAADGVDLELLSDGLRAAVRRGHRRPADASPPLGGPATALRGRRGRSGNRQDDDGRADHRAAVRAGDAADGAPPAESRWRGADRKGCGPAAGGGRTARPPRSPSSDPVRARCSRLQRINASPAARLAPRQQQPLPPRPQPSTPARRRDRR